MGVGKGSRYSLPTSKREVNALNKRFTAWVEAQAPKADPEVEAPEVEVTTTDAPFFSCSSCAGRCQISASSRSRISRR